MFAPQAQGGKCDDCSSDRSNTNDDYYSNILISAHLSFAWKERKLGAITSLQPSCCRTAGILKQRRDEQDEATWNFIVFIVCPWMLPSPYTHTKCHTSMLPLHRSFSCRLLSTSSLSLVFERNVASALLPISTEGLGINGKNGSNST